MLEFSLLFIVAAIFFLILYLKQSKEHFERDKENAVPFIEILLKYSTLFFALLSLLLSFGFSAVGDPVQTTVLNNTYVNFTFLTVISNGVSAGNVTTQNYPVSNSTVKTITTDYSDDQMVLINGVYQLINSLGLMFILILVVTGAMRFLQERAFKNQRRQEGDYDS